ncbi:DUF6414 family protein [Xenorhabdus stockiae]|uniref:DUF6414 family protein n=1 Tax=Xenorhabdus stockiae TaxID=351614 RepID=UPI004063CFA6
MAQDSQGTGSLYDFLYLDKDRIYSIIAQLNGNGVLKTLKQTNGEKNSDTSELDMTGEANAMLLKAKGNAKKKLTEELHDSLELTHDTTWSIPLQLLDLLAQGNHITFGTHNSRLGSLSLLGGCIKVFDVATLKQALPLFAQFMQSQEIRDPSIKNKNKKKSKNKVNSDDIEIVPNVTFGVMNNFLSIVPDSLLIDFYEDTGNESWIMLNKNNLTINASDLFLKYGTSIPGKWYVLGIIDALPDHLADENEVEFDDDEHELRAALSTMTEELRVAFGRKPRKYGVTPLIIFRQIQQ